MMIHDESSIPRPWETVEDFLLENHEVIEGFEKALEDSVRIRTIGTMPSLCRNCARSFLLSRSSNAPDCDHPKIGILFSGGLVSMELYQRLHACTKFILDQDSAVLASLADRVISPSESIALINVSFGGNHAPDRQTARQALRELRYITHFVWNFVDLHAQGDFLQFITNLILTSLMFPGHQIRHGRLNILK